MFLYWIFLKNIIFVKVANISDFRMNKQMILKPLKSPTNSTNDSHFPCINDKVPDLPKDTLIENTYNSTQGKCEDNIFRLSEEKLSFLQGRFTPEEIIEKFLDSVELYRQR